VKAPDHLNALRALDAAARHLSFALAAEELSVTPAAVGQLVRRLEETLGVELFHRSRTGPARLVLTEAAVAALPDLQSGFAHLSAAMNRLRSARKRQTLAITVPTAFAEKWLLPRLDGFRALHPDCELRIDIGIPLVDFATQSVDVGIRYGAGRWSGLSATLFARDEFFPVCSPLLLDGKHPLRSPEDLRHHQLIHDSSMTSPAGFPTWRDWYLQVGLPVAESERGLHINNSAAVTRMAVAGQGVALGRSKLIEEELAETSLICPFGPKIDCPFAYYVVCRMDDVSDPTIVSFRDWLISKASQASDIGNTA
jgi:LysR family transcriptional regulator, glycine cleavage system transcriptional activator